MTAGFPLDDAAWASPWRHRAVAEKLLLAGGLLAVAIMLPAWPASVLSAATALIVLIGPARVAPGVLARVLAAPLAFVVVGAVSVLVSLQWDGGPVFTVTEETQRTALTSLSRGTAGTLGVLVIAATTPMADLLGALRRLHVPEACIDVAALVYRLVLVLFATLVQMGEAQAARLGYRDRCTALRSSAALGAGLLLRSWDRARRLEDGLAGRGYTGSLPSLDPPRRTSVPFVASSLATVGVIAVTSLTAKGW